MEKFNVIYHGRLLEGHQASDVRDALGKRFKMPREKVDRLLGGGRRILKKDMEHARAYALNEALRAAGLDSGLERAAVTYTGLNLKLEEKTEEEKAAELEEAREVTARRDPGDLPIVDGLIECPRCQNRQAPADACESCGIYFAKFLAMQKQSEASGDRDERGVHGDASNSYAGPSSIPRRNQESWDDTLKAALKLVAPIVVVAVIVWRIWSFFAPGPPSKGEVYDYYQDACFVDAECKRLLNEQFDACYEEAEPERMEDFAEAEMLNGFLEFAGRMNQCIVYPDGTKVFFSFDELDAAFFEALQEAQ